MNQITSPLQPGMQGPTVADLQDALQLLISRQFIKSSAPPNRPTADELQTLVQKLNQERAQSTYSAATQQLVRYFQNQNGLGDSFAGAVEAKTAQVLNTILTDLGASAIILNTVSGTIYDVTNAPMPNVIVQVDLRTEYEILMKVVTAFLKESETSLAAIATSGEQMAFVAAEVDVKPAYLDVAAAAELLTHSKGRERDKRRVKGAGLNS